MLEWGLFSSAALLVGWIGTTALAAHQIALQVGIDHVHGAVRHLAGRDRARRPRGRPPRSAATRRAGFAAMALGAAFMAAMTLLVVALRNVIPLLFLGGDTSRATRDGDARRARCCWSARPSSSPTACRGSRPARCAA